MNCVYTRQFQLMIVISNMNKNDISDLQARTKQLARIHTRSLINIEKILNRLIAKFYNSDDVNVIAAELRLTKTRRTSFYKKQYRRMEIRF